MDFVWITLIMIFSHQSTPTESVYKTGCIARSVFAEAQAMVAGGYLGGALSNRTRQSKYADLACR
jgi:hypothetical protein